MDDLFAVVTPGLETIAAKEMHDMGMETFTVEKGGIALKGNIKDIYKMNLYLRTASRILIRLGHFHSSAFSELEKKSRKLPWEVYLKANQPISIRATCHKSRLYHSDAVIERVVEAIGNHLGSVPNHQKTKNIEDANLHQLITVRLLNDECTISIDTSGELLHRRGYRLANAKAPLRETLAAGIIIATGWEKDKPLLDPFCGSGTIPIEAALMALGIPPGIKRQFSFMSWPNFEEKTWTHLLKSVNPRPPKDLTLIQASDRDAGAITMARANAARAGVSDYIQFECQSISAISPPSVPGWLITNPPYGLRIHSNKDIRNLYAQFGKVLRTNCTNWRTAVLCSDPALLSQTGLKFTSKIHFSNGGINVSLGECVVP
jgi:putative N6-adenine-specific DNA methylase